MKQLIVVILMMGLANTVFARSEDDHKQSNRSQQTQSVTGNYDYEPPRYDCLMAPEMCPLGKLSYLLGYRGKNMDSKYYYTQTPLPVYSKIQLIVDEGGNIMDCELLESSDGNKDHTVINFLPESNLFHTPGKLNGEPCKSIVYFYIGYYLNGNFSLKMNSYPVMNLPDSDLDTADLNSSPNN